MGTKNKGPEFLKYITPLIEVLKEQGGAGRSSEIRQLVVSRLNIPESEVEVMLKSGVSRVLNQIDWARNYLKEWELLSSGERGIWRLTDSGLRANLSFDEIYHLFQQTQEKLRNKSVSKPNVEQDPSLNLDEIVPEETIYQNEFLKLLKRLSPYGFEKLCRRLLIEEGFQNVEITKQSRDGGIDGVAKLNINRFVSFKVFFQCKRYKGGVGSEEIQMFIGAIDGETNPGDKGLIITTGHFTESAKKAAEKKGGFPIELIDGEKLVEMFESLELGLNPKTIYEIDQDFFEEFK